MKRAGFLAIAMVATVLGAATAASASPAVPIALSESIDFVRPPGEPPAGTFTLSGLGPGVCPTGISVDSLVSFNHDFTRIVIERRYICADGAGGFSALQVLNLDGDPATQTESVSGTWVIRDGFGALAQLHGAGRTQGVNVGCNPRCTSGTSTVEAIAHLN